MEVSLIVLSCIICIFAISPVISVVYRGSSPSGETVIAVSSSNPDIEKYFSLNHPALGGSSQGRPNLSAISKVFPDNIFDGPFTFVGPGQAFAGSGRGFASAHNFLPILFRPFSFEGFGLNNSNGANWIKKIEDLYDSRKFGNGEVRTVSAVNDNGRVYGEVKSVTLDDKGRSHVVKSVVN